MHLPARINNVYTAPDWRRRGLARTLIEQVLDDCRARGIVYATLAATRDGAALYAALGFAPAPGEMTRSLDAAPPALS